MFTKAIDSINLYKEPLVRSASIALPFAPLLSPSVGKSLSLCSDCSDLTDEVNNLIENEGSLQDNVKSLFELARALSSIASTLTNFTAGIYAFAALDLATSSVNTLSELANHEYKKSFSELFKTVENALYLSLLVTKSKHIKVASLVTVAARQFYSAHADWENARIPEAIAKTAMGGIRGYQAYQTMPRAKNKKCAKPIMNPSPVSGSENPLAMNFVEGEEKHYQAVACFSTSCLNHEKRETSYFSLKVESVDQDNIAKIRYAIGSPSESKEVGEIRVDQFGNIQETQGNLSESRKTILSRIFFSRPSSMQDAERGWDSKSLPDDQTGHYSLTKQGTFEGKHEIKCIVEKNTSSRVGSNFSPGFTSIKGGNTRVQIDNDGWVESSHLNFPKTRFQIIIDQIKQPFLPAKSMYLSFQKNITHKYNLLIDRVFSRKIVKKQSQKSEKWSLTFHIKNVADDKTSASISFTAEKRSSPLKPIQGSFHVNEQGAISELNHDHDEKRPFIIEHLNSLFCPRPPSDTSKFNGWVQKGASRIQTTFAPHSSETYLSDEEMQREFPRDGHKNFKSIGAHKIQTDGGANPKEKGALSLRSKDGWAEKATRTFRTNDSSSEVAVKITYQHE